VFHSYTMATTTTNIHVPFPRKDNGAPLRYIALEKRKANINPLDMDVLPVKKCALEVARHVLHSITRRKSTTAGSAPRTVRENGAPRVYILIMQDLG